jgi:hypothetical protein
MPAIDSRIAAATTNGPYMAAAPSRGSSFVGSPGNIAHAASGVNHAGPPSGAGDPAGRRDSHGLPDLAAPATAAAALARLEEGQRRLRAALAGLGDDELDGPRWTNWASGGRPGGCCGR